jgi:putative ABC transport system permease protein
MIKNYFKIAWRNIVKHRFYSIVNIVGLFAGIIFTLLIGAYVWGELQVNKNLLNADHQYILQSEWKDPNMGYELATLGPLAKKLKEDYPALVKSYFRFDGISSIVSKGNNFFRESVALGDSTLLRMYGFKLLYGDAGTALNNPFNVVITKEKAIKYFGKVDVVGETIGMRSNTGDKQNFTITGVLGNVDENSVTRLDVNNDNTFYVPISSFSYFGRNDPEAWRNIQIASYVELNNGITAKDLEGPIKQLLKQHTSMDVQQNLLVKPTPLSEYYLQKDKGLVKRMLYTLSFIGLFILMMAIVNFVNMGISSLSARIRETGVRKVMGSLQRHIIFQFLTESIVLVLIATILALIAYPFFKPMFESLIGKVILPLVSFPVYFIFMPVILVLLVGTLAGLYPAISMASIKSVDAVKGKFTSVKNTVMLRKSLVGFQFCMAIVVMVASFIITQQINYLFSNQLGYNKEYIVSSQVPRDWSPKGVRKMETVRNEFASMSQISSATLSYEIPDGNNGDQPPLYRMGEDSSRAVAMQLLITDENYADTYQIPLKSGSFFSGNQTDSAKIIINEKAVATLGWKQPQEAIGQLVRIPGDPTIFTIKGVTNDFHFGSMQQNVAPLFFFNVQFAPNYRYLSFKIKPGNIPQSIAAIEKKWAQLLPGSSFEYTFMDDTLKKLYTNEIQLRKAAFTATVLSLIIVLLGILGLVSLSIHKRVKEISIRKVLGASVPNITLLFMKEFMVVVVIAAVIACPVAWYLMQGWLGNYAYRIPLTAPPFLWPVIALGLLTLLLIALQTLKVALANPMKNLRSE